MEIKNVLQKLKKAGFKAKFIYPKKLPKIKNKEEISHLREYSFEKNNFSINFTSFFDENEEEFAFCFWIRNKKDFVVYYKRNIDAAIDFCLYSEKNEICLYLERNKKWAGL